MNKEHVEYLDGRYRQPAEIVNPTFADINPDYLEAETSRNWWDLIGSITLMVTREHEHFVMAISGNNGIPEVSCFPVPHPNGVAANRNNLFIASTRNPNAIYQFVSKHNRYTLQSIQFYPGSLRLHELYWHEARGCLLANATGYNSVISIDGSPHRREEWTLTHEKCDLNYRAHVNSIGHDESSDAFYFSAFLEQPVYWDQKKMLDKRGVIFDEHKNVVARGLTAPHSARIYRGRLFVCDSGYGCFGEIDDCGTFQSLAKFNGWTRGVCFYGDHAFVGVSKVILEKSRQYAPGFVDNAEDTECAIYAVNLKTGTIEEFIRWGRGAHIFDICAMPFCTFSYDWN